MAMRDVQELVGRRVKADLGADGIYVGELLELTGADWNGRMRVTGVIAPAQHQTNGTARRGHRPGEFVQVGRSRLSQTSEQGHETYLAALAADAGRKLGSHSGRQTSTHGWVFDALARALQAAYRAEEHRVVTGNWRLIPESPFEAARLEMNFADGFRPALNVDESPEVEAPGKPSASLGSVVSTQLGFRPVSPQWARVLTAMDELRQSLDRHKMMAAYPDVAHDFMAVLASLEAMRGDALFEEFWRAQMARVADLHPNMKNPPAPTIMRPGGSVYAYQEPGPRP